MVYTATCNINPYSIVWSSACAWSALLRRHTIFPLPMHMHKSGWDIYYIFIMLHNITRIWWCSSFFFFFSCTLAMPKVVCCHDVVCQCRLTEVANSDSNKYFFHRKYLRRSIWWSPEANLSAFTPNQTTTHLLLLSFSQIRLKSSRPPPLFEQSLFHSFTCVLCTHETRWMYNKYIISATAICDILFPCFWSIHQVHDANA